MLGVLHKHKNNEHLSFLFASTGRLVSPYPSSYLGDGRCLDKFLMLCACSAKVFWRKAALLSRVLYFRYLDPAILRRPVLLTP